MSKKARNTSSRVIPLFAVKLFMFSISIVSAQQPGSGFNREILSTLSKNLNKKNVDEHSNIQPAAHGLENELFTLKDSTQNTEKNNISAGLIGSISGGYQLVKESKALAPGYVGLNIKWNNNEHWSSEAGYTLVGGMLPGYLDRLADSLQIMPGVGYAINDGNNLRHAHYTYGHLSYSKGKHFHFEIGKGKNFWGDGYRSMILSDNASSYPYLRITTKVWKLKYTNLWMQMRDLSAGQLLKSARIKYVAMHALSFNATKKFNFSIYEMVVWQDRDTMSQRTLDINYLNPIIFYRPVEYSIGSPDNIILAASMKYKASTRLQLYGQFVLDEFNLRQFEGNKKWWGNKFGGQFGMKAFDLFAKGVNFQTEVNFARPFTYTHGSPIQSWTHLNQSLAHPMGCNFIEWVNFMRYDFGKWKILEQFTWAAFGRDKDVDNNGSIDNLGGNVLRSYKDPYKQYGHKLLQGEKSNFYFHSLTISRKILDSETYELFLNHCIRYEENQQSRKLDNFILVGIRMSGLLTPANDF